MNVFRPIGIAGLAWRDTAPGLRHRDVWAPVLILGLVQAGLLSLLLAFTTPGLEEIAVPLVRLLGGEAATHYPDHLFALPAMFDLLALGVHALGVPLVAGILCLRYARLFGVVAADAPRRLPRRAVLPLLAVGLVSATLHAAAARVLLGALAAEAPPKSIFLLWLAEVGICAALVYCTPWIVLRGSALLPALGRGALLALRQPVPTFLLVAVPLALWSPFSVAVPHLPLAESPVRPELGAWAVVGRILVEMPVLIVIAGSTTRLFVSRRSRRR